MKITCLLSSQWFQFWRAGTLHAQSVPPWPTQHAEAQGVSCQPIQNFIETADSEVNLDAQFYAVRHGHVLPKHGGLRVRRRGHMFSWLAEQSLLRRRRGWAVADGKLKGVDDRVLKFFSRRR